MNKNTVPLNGGLHITKAEPVDDRLLGDSLVEYKARVLSTLRYIGLAPIIVIGGVATPYIFKDGIADANLVPITNFTGFNISSGSDLIVIANTDTIVLADSSTIGWVLNGKIITANFVKVLGLTDITGLTAALAGKQPTGNYLTEFIELDPLFVASPAYNITSNNITNWNSAFGWGNHTNLYRPITYVPSWDQITGVPTTMAGYGITDVSNKINPSIDRAIVVTSGTEGTIVNAPATIDAYGKITSVGLSSTINTGVAVEGYSNDILGAGVLACGIGIGLIVSTMDLSPTGIKLVEVLNARVPLTPVQVGYGYERRVDLPWLGGITCYPMFRDTYEYSKTTVYEESGIRKLWARRDGAWFLQSTLDEYGNLTIAGTLTSQNSGAKIVTITLPAASATVLSRCNAAVAGVDYPVGWTLNPWISNANDLYIVHNLDKRIMSVRVYYTTGLVETLLLGTAEYSGIVSPNRNTIRISALATQASPLVIHLLFA